MDELIKSLYKDAKIRYAKDTGEMLIDRINKTAQELTDIESLPYEEYVEKLFKIINDHIKPTKSTVNFDMLKDLLELRYDYYMAGTELNSDTLHLYKDMAEKSIIYYANVVGEGSKFDIKLNFILNPFRSTASCSTR